MLTLGPSIKVYLARGTVDMRKSFDGLAAAVREVLKTDPHSGHLFVFCGRRRHMVKVLYSDSTGSWIVAKRLARGTFAWPEVDDDRTTIELRADELGALLGGIDLRRTKWRPWWRRPAAATLPAPPIPVLPAL